MSTPTSRVLLALLLTSLTSLSAGCSVYSLTGDTMAGYATEHLTPYVLTTSDVQMACGMGASVGPLLLSFERVTDTPDRAAVLTYVTAALCAERAVWPEQLRALRAFKERNVAEAQDAQFAQKRAHAVAAARYWAAYQRAERLYPETLYAKEGECPELDDQGEFVTISAMIAGLQSVQHDRASGVLVGVPTDTPRKVLKRARCFDEAANKRWWGVPKALEAAIWLVVPGSGPKTGAELTTLAYDQLKKSATLGQEAGVRLADSVFAYAAHAMGDEATTKAVIKGFAASRAKTPSAQAWRLFDEVSALQLQALSDVLWTRAKGHRTPNELGAFWDDVSEATDLEAEDDLLDEL